MLLTFVVFVGYGLFAAAIRSHVVSRPRVLTWMRRTFAAAFVALGAKLALAERWLAYRAPFALRVGSRRLLPCSSSRTTGHQRCLHQRSISSEAAALGGVDGQQDGVDLGLQPRRPPWCNEPTCGSARPRLATSWIGTSSQRIAQHLHGVAKFQSLAVICCSRT
jgi:hypothetical protein